MAPFRYDTFNPGPRYEDRYAGAIAGTLRDMGNLRAQTALNVANANAEATRASGQIWGQAIGQIGQAVGNIPVQMQQAQQDARRNKILDAQLADQERTRSTRDRVNALLSDREIYGDDGTINMQAITQRMSGALPEGASGPTQPVDAATLFDVVGPINQHLTAARTAKSAWETSKQQAVAKMAHGVLQIGSKTGDFVGPGQIAIGSLMKSGLLSQEDGTRMLTGLVEQPAEVTAQQLQELATLGGVKPEKPTLHNVAPGGAVINETGKVVFQAPFAPTKVDAPTAGTLGDYLTHAYPGRSLGSLTAAEVLKAKNDFEAAGRAPVKPNEEGHSWITRNGEILRVSESGIQPGDTPAPAGGGQLTANAEATLTRQLAGQWTQAQKPARDLERQVALIDAGMNAARRGDLAQGAQTVLVAFQKILDPTSVVRESEFDRSAAGQSYYNRIAGAMERITKGGAGVRLEELEKFHTLAKEAAQAQQGAYLQSIKERIGLNADRYNIPRQLVFEAMPEGADSGPPAAPVNPFRK